MTGIGGWRGVALVVLLGAGVGAAVVAVLDRGLARDDAKIGRVVHGYLLAHPEILPEAMQRLQARETSKLLANNRSAIETPFAGAWAGAHDADVTLVEFTDYACGFCRSSLADVNRLLTEDAKLRVVYRELPILSRQSVAAAKVALSAARKDRYAEFRDGLYRAGAPSPTNIGLAARAADIDPAGGTRDEAIGGEIAKNLAIARTLGLSGTPSFVIGDQMLAGAVGYPALKKAIAAERAKRG